MKTAQVTILKKMAKAEMNAGRLARLNARLVAVEADSSVR